MHQIIRSAMVAGTTLAPVFSGTTGATAFLQPSVPQMVNVAAAKKTAPVTVNKIGNKTVEGSKKAIIKPSYKTTKKVKVTSALLTVKNGSKTATSNKKSASLGAGTYKVTTTVKYTVNSKAASVKKTEPEERFNTPSDAKKAGYRASHV